MVEVTVRLPKFSKPFEVEKVVVSVPIFKVHFGDINVKPGTFSVRSVTGDISVNVGSSCIHYATSFSFTTSTHRRSKLTRQISALIQEVSAGTSA